MAIRSRDVPRGLSSGRADVPSWDGLPAFTDCPYEEMRMNASKPSLPEPWLRGTLADVPVVARGVLHALELAWEDANKWCGGLSDIQIHSRPAGRPLGAIPMRHNARRLQPILDHSSTGE